MPSDMQINEDQRTILIKVTEDLNTNRICKLIDQIALSIKLYHGCSILVDIRDNTFQSGMTELLEAAATCAKRLAGYQHKMAILIPDTEEQVKMARIFKTCMDVKGFNFQDFINYDDAMEWLGRL